MNKDLYSPSLQAAFSSHHDLDITTGGVSENVERYQRWRFKLARSVLKNEQTCPLSSCPGVGRCTLVRRQHRLIQRAVITSEVMTALDERCFPLTSVQRPTPTRSLTDRTGGQRTRRLILQQLTRADESYLGLSCTQQVY